MMRLKELVVSGAMRKIGGVHCKIAEFRPFVYRVLRDERRELSQKKVFGQCVETKISASTTIHRDGDELGRK